MRRVRIGHAATKNGKVTSWALPFPMELAKLLGEENLREPQFVPELTEDGILYRRVDPLIAPEKPRWVQDLDS